MMHGEWQRRRLLVLCGALLEGSLAALAWALGWFLDHPPLESFRWSARDAALGALASLPLFGLSLLFLRRPWGPLGRIKQFLDEVVKPLFGSCSLAELGIVSLSAGIGEEMLFRAVIQAASARSLGTWPGLAVASIVFGLAHPITPIYALGAGLVGAYLGWLWVASGNLLVVIVTHALYDFLALVVLTRDRPAAGL